MTIGGLRWLMIGLVFLATIINYIDRQTVSVLKTAISQDVGLSNADYAAIQAGARHRPGAGSAGLDREGAA